MPQLTTTNDIRTLGRILCVGAHPDDETWIAGGLIAAACRNGQQVVVLTATQGEAGTTDEQRWPTHRLAETRAQELHEALRLLGVTAHGWLGCRDGECDCADEAAMVECLAHSIAQLQPDSLVTFDPQGLTGHPDHQAVSAWCQMALEQVAKPPQVYHAVYTPEWYSAYGRDLHEKTNAFFNIDEPPLVPAAELAIHLELTDELQAQKLAALRAQPSQTEDMLAALGGDGLPPAFATEFFVKAE